MHADYKTVSIFETNFVFRFTKCIAHSNFVQESIKSTKIQNQVWSERVRRESRRSLNVQRHSKMKRHS